MNSQRAHLWRLAAATLFLATTAFAQFNPGDPIPTSPPVGNNNNNDDNDNNNRPFPGFDAAPAFNQRRIHGILASLTFTILLPLGALTLRLLPGGRWSLWTHTLLQLSGWALFVGGAAPLGFAMVRGVRVTGGGNAEGYLLYDPRTKYHPIIGIVVFVLLVAQPLLGWLHHRRFAVEGRRMAVSYLHLWNGRVLVVLGIVNGGFGLKVSGASDMVMLAYTIVASILGGAWIIVAVLSELRRMRGRDVFGRLKRGELRVPWRRSRGQGVRMVRIDKAMRSGSADGPVVAPPDAYGTVTETRYA